MQQTVKKWGIFLRVKNDFYLKKTYQLLKFYVFSGQPQKPEKKIISTGAACPAENGCLPVPKGEASLETERPVKTGHIREQGKRQCSGSKHRSLTSR